MAALSLHHQTISRSAVLSTVLALAMLTSSIVFSEPAPVDALMAGFIVALCVMGGGRLGALTISNLVLWLPIIAFGLIAAHFSPDFGAAVTHQIITLFLVLGGAAIAAFIANDPEPRANLILNCYVIGIIVACLLGYIGYFKLVPGAYDLFTNYGRARGSYKDPNVFGAALGPAITYLGWRLLRWPSNRSLLSAAGFLFMMPALLISFSRGAWVSVVISLAVLGFVALARTRRQSDHIRMASFAIIGIVTIVATLTAVLQIPQVNDLMRQRASLTQGYDEGPEGRFGGQKKGAQLIMENPLGIGTHTFRKVHHHEEVHNVYLTMFHYSGWPGGLLFIASILTTFAFGLAGALRLNALQGAFTVATAALAGIIVEGLIIDSDHWRHLYIVLGLIWGLSDSQFRTSISTRRWYDPVKAMRNRRGQASAMS